MNKEDYVSMEVAKLLKEKEFNEKCNHYWWQHNDDTRLDSEGFRFTREWIEVNNDCYDGVWLAPTLYEAAKWLRNEHGIYVTIISSPITWLYKNNDGSYITHFPVITYRDTEGKIKMSYHQGMNDSEYEKAFNYAILEALKLI